MKTAATRLEDGAGGEALRETLRGKDGALLAVAEKLRGELAGLLARAGRSEKMGVEFVHDLRVATRRMEEAARLLADLMEDAAAEGVRASLQEVRRAAGEVRDADVTGGHLAAVSGKWRLPAALRPPAKEFLEEMAEEREEMAEKLHRAAGAASVMGAMVMLARVIEENSAKGKTADAQRRLREELEKQQRRREKGVQKAFGKAVKKQTPGSLHAARIAAKKLRYVLELAEAGGDESAKHRIHMLKDVQDLLGDHHDMEVLLELVGEQVESADGKGAAAAYRKWRRAMQREQARRAAAFFVKSYAWMNA